MCGLGNALNPFSDNNPLNKAIGVKPSDVTDVALAPLRSVRDADPLTQRLLHGSAGTPDQRIAPVRTISSALTRLRVMSACVSRTLQLRSRSADCSPLHISVVSDCSHWQVVAA